MKTVCTVLVFLALAVIPAPGTSYASTQLKIGIYQDYPLVFADENGEAKGAYIDVLEFIAEKEAWDVDYVACQWSECLIQLENGSLDLLTAIAFSEERTKKYDFNEETFFPNWGQVYATRNVEVNSITDLAGKTVAGLRDDIYYTNLQQVAANAELDITYVDVNEYEEVFKLLEQKKVDAGVLPRLFGDLNENRFNVKKTTTIIRPSELRFASPKGSKQNILAVIDKHLRELKSDKNSLYFKSISSWLGQQETGVLPEVDLTEKERTWLANHRQIIIGVDPEFVPFEFIEADGSYRGMCADYVRIVSERTGLNMKVAPDLMWNEVIEKAKAGQIDVLPCVGMTEDRKKYLSYSNPHQSFYRVVVTREGAKIGNAPDDLQGLRVAVQKNSSHHGFLQDTTDIEPLLFETAEQAIFAVSEGDADVFVGNENMSGYTINKNAIVNLKMTKMAGSMPKNLHFAVRSELPELLSIINKGLDSISEKEREAIQQKWIAVKIEKHIDYAFMYKAIGAVLCFVLVFSLWNSHIQRQRKRLLQSEEKYRTLVEGLHEGYFFYTHDLQGVFTYISPSVSNFLGYSPSELMINYSAILTDNPINKDVDRFTELCMQGKPQPSYMVEVFHKDGSIRWLEVSEVPIYDKRGRVVSVEGIAHDITERLQAEEGLRESEEKYRAIFENANDMIVIAQDGRIAFANAALERILGYTTEEVVAKPFTEFIHPDDREMVFSRYKKRMSGEDVETGYQFRLITSSGEERWVIINSSALEWDKKISTLNFITDITEQKLAEKEVMEAKELAEEANKAKSTFLANMSHELRTPLNAILGFSELMARDSSLSAEHLKNLETIGSSGEHLLSLINDVLELSKIEAGQVALHPENFDLYRLLSVIEEMFSLRAGEKGLSLAVERASGIPRFVRTDQGKLRQSLINILGNAVKFTTQGGIILRVKNNGNTLLFEIEDTGIGIVSEDLEKVFSTFVQSNSGKEYKQGSGLGIPISQKFIQMMGGELTVESEVGKGTIFRFNIQIEEVDKNEVDKTDHEHKVVGLAPDQKQFRLLVVEDDENSRHLLVTLLRQTGFDVRSAENGEEAVGLWKEWQPHFIWMDIRMSGMDGYEATRTIRKLPGGTKTIIVALTAHAFEEDRKRVLKSGCNDFVRKPFRESELLGIMQKYLGVRYLYEDRALHEKVDRKKMDEKWMSDAVRALPASIYNDFAHAVQSIDFDKTMLLINLIREQDQDLASGLTKLLHSYRFDKLQEFLG